MKLVEACKVGDLEVVQNAVEVDGIDPDFEKNLPLRTAARHGHFEVVKYLMAIGNEAVNPVERNHDGKSDDESDYSYLYEDYHVEKGKEPHVTDAAFVQACAYGHEDIVDLFLAEKRTLQFLLMPKSHALPFAIANGHFSIVKRLWHLCYIQYKEDVRMNKYIWFAVALSRNIDMFRFFEGVFEQDGGAHASYQPLLKRDALAAVARFGDLDMVKFMVENGTDCSHAVGQCFGDVEHLSRLKYLLENYKGNKEYILEELGKYISNHSRWEDQDYKGIKLVLTSKLGTEALRRRDPDGVGRCIYGLADKKQTELLHYVIDDLGFDCIMGRPSLGTNAICSVYPTNWEIIRVFIRRKEVQKALNLMTQPITVTDLMPFYKQLQDDTVKLCKVYLSIDLPVHSVEVRSTILAMACGKDIILSFEWGESIYQRAYDLFFSLLLSKQKSKHI